ncbi:hypothetical protein N7491_006366 [Penicillium cf. griseofulvum]|uniref:Uncharacterized protein n=1 Tax=Penicillium cf. griseofulvum TaxID=2972120 RepID=A0A9W9IY78_9EURO|nr:hypothetical protein N7472_010606 [Penicillium cf. griseofulvum]KAJ5429350.1 hypothetical protein N7491_006366 [Penicillium cf. griseofulvum]KAJ5436871.1 hypothetical protein N7445_007756 [Penicillium cf. griseofulvum]
MPVEHTRDWSTLLPAERPNGQMDQAFQLPEIECFTLYRFPCVLKHPSHYTEWRKEIFYTLKMHNLHRLIDSSITRPYKDSPNARRWQQMSIEVRNWIAWNINPILVRMIVKELPRAQLADEFMTGADVFLQQFNRSPPPHYEDISSVLFKFIQCERSDYSSARSFVYGIMEKYTHTLNMKLGIPPFIPMLILLAEIEGDVGKAFVNVRYERLENMNNIAEDITKGYFENVYFDVLEYLEALEQPRRSIEEV